MSFQTLFAAAQFIEYEVQVGVVGHTDGTGIAKKNAVLGQQRAERSLDHDRVLQEMQTKEILLYCIIHDLLQPFTGVTRCLILLGEEQFSSKGRPLIDIGIQESAKPERLIQNVLHTFAADV